MDIPELYFITPHYNGILISILMISHLIEVT